MSKPTVTFNELEGAFFWADFDDFDNAAFICRRTGQVYETGGEPGAVEREDPPDDLDDETRYARVPKSRDLVLGSRLVFRFAREQAPHLYDEVSDIFHRKGAYRRFRAWLDHHDLTTDWQTYQNTATQEALIEWAEDEGFEVTDVPAS